MTRSNLSVLSALLGGMITCAAVDLARAQSVVAPSIRVESHQVAVPTLVFDKKRGESVTGLALGDFHIFEDGKEQSVATATEVPIYATRIEDNVGVHVDVSTTPPAKWVFEGPMEMEANNGGLYLVTYSPPPSAEGECHRIKVKVERRDVDVFARSEYCRTQHSSSDPLHGTKLGRKMERYAWSSEAGKIPLSVQVSNFLQKDHRHRIFIVVEFPTDKWKVYPGDGCPTVGDFSVAIFGVVHTKNGVLANRFTDNLEDRVYHYIHPMTDPRQCLVQYPEEKVRLLLPRRHEAQLDLPAGEFDLRIVITDGMKSGRIQIPLTLNDYDDSQLAISGIALCKRFHESKPAPTSMHDTGFGFAPLVSGGLAFTPSADSQFKRGERMFVYFEIYKPLTGSAGTQTVQTRIRITDVKTGEIKVDTGFRNADSWVKPGNPVISVAQEIAVDKLPVGSYRLDVRASGSGEDNTISRATDFTVK
jgi:hypothetical protein